MIITLLQQLPSLIRQAFQDKEPENCPICIDTIMQGDLATTPCVHKFHADCLQTWAEGHNTCPICRSSLKSRITRLYEYLTGTQPVRAEPRLPTRGAARGTRPIHNRR